MKIAIPIHQGILSLHFGHSEEFALFEVDPQAKTIRDKEILRPPHHEPGNWPRWLREEGADIIIADAMSMRAQKLFVQNKTKIILGAPSEDPESIVTAYLDGNLKAGKNIYGNKESIDA